MISVTAAKWLTSLIPATLVVLVVLALFLTWRDCRDAGGVLMRPAYGGWYRCVQEVRP